MPLGDLPVILKPDTHGASLAEGNHMHILLADDQKKVRFALRVLLERQPGVSIVGEVANDTELLSQIQETCPDVLLLAWELPDGDPASLLLEVHRLCPALVVIVLSGRPEVRQAALAAGADSFVSKGDPPECLLTAIESCCD
jgi:DNA-binding NarL/FixJ family response regulator